MNFRNIFLCFMLFYHFTAEAKLFQILHTNDTHSFLDSATHDKNRGGFARLKSLIEYYKDRMSSEGIQTLTFDSGDFTEGNIYYMADAGKKSYAVHDSIGYDAVTLGNHDYLMGTKDFDNILGEINFNFTLLGANVSVNPFFKNVKNNLVPYKEITLDGIKFGVFGVTTNEIFYKWRFDGGSISNPIKSALHYEDVLRKRKNDVVIGLTHIGFKKDMKFGSKSKEVDLIIGGHSHTTLSKPFYVTNKNNKLVPIVQAGEHTEYLGRMIIDVEKNRPLKVVSYELIPVKYEAKDEKVEALVQEANNDLNQLYGNDWLDTVVGSSDLKSNDKFGVRKWAYYITDTLREKTHSDIAIHTPPMNGENYPIGTITRRDLMNSIPRIFDLQDKYGWSIYTTKIRGIWLQMIFETLARFGQPLTFSGMTMEYEKTPVGIKIRKVLVNGKKINPFKSYTVAFTEGVVRGAEGVSKYTLGILRFPRKSPHKIWDALEEKLSRESRSMKMQELNEENRAWYNPEEE